MNRSKAFVVTEHAEGFGGVVFADRDIQARRIGAQEFADTDDITAVSCRRAPQFDGYAPGPVPQEVLIEHGWRFACACCGTMVDAQDRKPVIEGDHVFVSPWHRLRLVEHLARPRAEARLVRRIAGTALRIEVPGDAHAWMYRERGRTVAVCSFKFPGGQDEAEWRSDDPEHVMIAHSDLPAWEAFRGREPDAVNVSQDNSGTEACHPGSPAP